MIADHDIIGACLYLLFMKEIHLSVHKKVLEMHNML